MISKYIFQFIWFLCLLQPLTATLTIAKPGCKDTCGNITIPYPFGIGAHCFLDEWYEVLCLDNRPYLSKYYAQESQGEVLSISYKIDLLITINANNSVIHVCEDKGISLGRDLSGSPFYYNMYKLIVVGCGNFMLFANQNILGGCTSTCNQNRKINGCYGFNCCEIEPRTDYAQNFYLNFSDSETGSNSCASAIFLNSESYVNYTKKATNFSELSGILVGGLVPVELRWTIPEWLVTQLQSDEVHCYDAIIQNPIKVPPYYRCGCTLDCAIGNPYLPNGCQDRKTVFPCNLSRSNSRKRLISLVVVGTSLGILSLVAAIFSLYKKIRKRRERKLKEKFFKRNGGLLLRQQMSIDENTVDKIFTANELDKATDYFNDNRVLGRGGQGTVYKGMLADGKIVAVKKSKSANQKQIEQFINELVVISQINHRNVVKLLGCCLETDVPILVYEFIPNGTLYNLIHTENDEFLMSWDIRLRIATEVARALAYLHSATSAPVYHRDIKSSNILLDEKYSAKISDFGISRNITIDQTHLTTLVKGTFGYLDPEYFQSSQYTEKSDVYSFGVVLVELLTRQKPISLNRTDEKSCLNLATRFLTSMEEDSLDMILDVQVREISSYKQVTTVAKLSQRCLSLDGKKRPAMKEVVMELENIKLFHDTSTIPTMIYGESNIQVGSIVSSDGNSPWTTENDTIT